MLKSSFGMFIKAALPILVLLQPVTGQAEAALSEPAGPDSVATGADEKTANSAVSTATDKRAAFPFPGWPQRNARAESMEVIPSPPPGPYMSSALNDFSMRGRNLSAPSFDSGRSKVPEARHTSKTPMAEFNPDVKWPSNLRTPTRWLPENGYNYVKPQQQYNNRPYNSGQYNSRQYRQNVAPGYQGTYRRAPMMSMPDMNVQAPRAQAPRAQAPRTQAPRTQAPRAQAPRAQAPRAQAPRAPYPAPVRR